MNADPELERLLTALHADKAGELQLRPDDSPAVVADITRTLRAGYERRFGGELTVQMDGEYEGRPVLRLYVEGINGKSNGSANGNGRKK